MEIKEIINEVPIANMPDVKFTKKDHLQNKRKMKQFAWHATLSSNAAKILKNGSRANFSLTGNYEEAVSYAFQRAGSAKRDATVLQVDTTYIKDKETGDVYSTSATPHYFEVTHPLPPEAFSIADTLSFKDVIRKERIEAKKVLRVLAKQLPVESTFQQKYGIGLRYDTNPIKIKNFLIKNGWKLVDQYTMMGGSGGVNYELSMGSHKITVNKKSLSYDLKFDA